jgi:hypothetical protein
MGAAGELDVERLGGGGSPDCHTVSVLIVVILRYDPPDNVASGAAKRAGGRAIDIFAPTAADDRSVNAIVGEIYERERRDNNGRRWSRSLKRSHRLKHEAFLFLRCECELL